VVVAEVDRDNTRQCAEPSGVVHDSRFVFYQDILDEPMRRFNITTGSSERIVDCRSLLEGGVQPCGFEAVMPDGSVALRLTRGGHDVFSLELHGALGQVSRRFWLE